MIVVGVPKETFPEEQRVALTPPVLAGLKRAGCEILVETGAGVASGFADELYEQAGARIAPTREAVFGEANLLAQVLAYGANDRTGDADLPLLRRGQTVVGFLRPLGSAETVRALAATGVTGLAIELVPRITRAQRMDALSAMSTICGYKAAVLAADWLPRMFPMLMTAAGTITPAKVLVIGAGVAGLQACTVARRLGAQVSAYDIRPSSREQVESVGAKFVELPLETKDAEDRYGYARAQDESFLRRQRELMGKVVAENDVVIATAVVPGKKAPIIVTADMVAAMRPGSVIVDLAAERGGNCELTVMEETVVRHGVTIVGTINLASTVPQHASLLYSRTLAAFVEHLVKDGAIRLDLSDEIVRETLLVRGGEVVQPRVRAELGLPPLEQPISA